MNEQPGLTALHSALRREHNRVARGLARLNPHWQVETTYQQARRIVAAMLQVYCN